MAREAGWLTALGLSGLWACGAPEPFFVPLPPLEAGQSAVVVVERSGGSRDLESFEALGPAPRLQLESDSGASAYCAVLGGPLERLGLPLGRWDGVQAPTRALGELGILEALVLRPDEPSPAFRPDPRALGKLADLQVPDRRSCVRVAASAMNLISQTARIMEVVEVGGGRFLSIDDRGEFELHDGANRRPVGIEGARVSLARRFAFDPARKELWVRSLAGDGLARGAVPDLDFDTLTLEPVALPEDHRALDLDLGAPALGEPPMLVLLSVGPLGDHRITIRSGEAERQVVGLPMGFGADLKVRIAGAQRLILYTDDQLWLLDGGEPPRPIPIPPGTSVLRAGWAPPIGLLAGLSDGTVRRLVDESLETVVELGGWWVLDVAPFQRGFAYLLANGVIGQFIDGEGRCAETPVLGTLNDGRLVPAEERWFVTGLLPEGGTRLAVLPRADVP